MKELQIIKGNFHAYLEPDEFFSCVKNPEPLHQEDYAKISAALEESGSSFFLHRGRICTVTNFNGPAIWEISPSAWRDDLYIERQDKGYIDVLTPKKKRSYHITEVQEALQRTEVPNWEKDEWACEVLAYGYQNDLVAREPNGTYAWDDKGMVEINNFRHRILKNKSSARYVKDTDFGNHIYKISPATNHIPPFNAVVVDGTLHSMTKDGEPEAPLREGYQFQPKKRVENYTKEEALTLMIKGEKISQENSDIIAFYENGTFFVLDNGQKKMFNPADLSGDVKYAIAQEVQQSIPSLIERNENTEQSSLSQKV